MNTASQTQALPVGLSRSGPGIFDHEKLDAYQLELSFISWREQ
jgi:hypothetical protein